MLLAVLLGLSLSLPACQQGDDDDSAGDDDDSTGADADGDGWETPDDCDDARPQTWPGATELCDGLDNDCDGVVAGFEEDGDGDGEMDCAALLWGVASLCWPHYIELIDGLMGFVDSRASAGCPAENQSSASVTLTAQDGVEVSTSQDGLTMTGDCSSGSADFTGSLVFSGYQQPYQPATTTWDGELLGFSLAGSGFTLAGTGASAEVLHISGSLSASQDIRVDSGGADNASEWGGLSLAAQLEIGGFSGGIPSVLEDRTTDLQLEQTHNLDTCHVEQICDFEEETFSTAGSAAASTPTGSWSAETSALNWLYRFETAEPGAPETYTGCYLEPGSGVIEVTAPGAGAGAPSWTASITFDGDVACDGCGEVRVGETVVGPWCGLAPLEVPL